MIPFIAIASFVLFMSGFAILMFIGAWYSFRPAQPRRGIERASTLPHHDRRFCNRSTRTRIDD